MSRLLGNVKKFYSGAKTAVVKTGKAIDGYNDWVQRNQAKRARRLETAVRLERLQAEREMLRRKRRKSRQQGFI